MSNRKFFMAFPVTLLILLSVSMIPSGAKAEMKLRPFTSDGCSLVPDGNLSDLEKWRPCCVAHDKIYWLGGTNLQRQKADYGLGQCLRDHGMSTLESLAWVGAVRAGGGPLTGQSWRWGYGWYEIRDYGPLKAEELALAKPYLELFNLPIPIAQAPLIAGLLGLPDSTCLENIYDYLFTSQTNGMNKQIKPKMVSALRDHLGIQAFQVFLAECPGGYLTFQMNTDITQGIQGIKACSADQVYWKVEVVGTCKDIIKPYQGAKVD